MRILFYILALITPVAAQAADQVSLASEVFVERIKPDAQGKPVATLEKPSVVTPGDKLVFVLDYSNKGAAAATGFTVTNPMPDSVAFAAAEGAGTSVSVDGGKSWGQLASLKVAAPDGTSRPAVAGDVTHIRWTFAQPIAVGSGGKLIFRGVVK